MEIEQVCISFHMWRSRILSNCLFAARNNTKLRTFVSCRPNPNCAAASAFLINWKKQKFYVLPLFLCLSKTIQEIHQDKAKGILIAPDFPSQPFNPRLIEISLQIISVPP